MLINQQLDEEQITTDGDEHRIHLNIKWHSLNNILGVSSYSPSTGGFISFFNDKGGKPFYTTSTRAGERPKCICWNSTLTILVVGWSSGKMSLIDPLRKKENDTFDLGLDEICCCSWDNEGNVLVVADAVGHIKVLKFCENNFTQLKLVGEASVTDEIPTDIVTKQINLNIFEQPEKRSNVMTSIGKENAAVQEEFEKIQDKQNMVKLHRTTKVLQKDGKEHFSPVFIVATNKGGLYVLDPLTCQIFRIYQADSGIRQLLNVPNHLYILAITDGMMFYQLSIEDRLANDKIKVKLSGKMEHFFMTRIDSALIAFCYGEREIRLWDLENEDSAVLPLSLDKNYDMTDRIMCLSFSQKKDSIYGATLTGKVAVWRRYQGGSQLKHDSATKVDDCWRLQNAITLTPDEIVEMSWSPTNGALAINTQTAIQIFLSQGLDFSFGAEYAVIQLNPQLLSLLKIKEPSESNELQLHSHIRGFSVVDDFLLLWDDTKIQLDHIVFTNDSPLYVETIASFDINIQAVKRAVYYKNNIYLIEKDRISTHTTQGTLKNSINFHDTEGTPDVIDVNNNWLCIASSNGCISVYDFNEDLKLTFRSRDFTGIVSGEWEKFVVVKINFVGNRVSFTVQENESVCKKLFVWEADTGVVNSFSFATGSASRPFEDDKTVVNSKDEILRPKTSSKRQKDESEYSRYALPNHIPKNHFWDQNDSRFLVCEANHVKSYLNAICQNNDVNGNCLVLMFVTAEHGIQIHGLLQNSPRVDSLMFVNVPFLYFLKNTEFDDDDKPQTEQNVSRLVVRRMMDEFVGINLKDTRTISTMLNFCFYLCVGQMNDAFQAIKYIKNERVWEHMAQMCVKTRRIDVAKVCLSHTKNWRAFRALNSSIARNESADLQAALLAIELDMIEEAKSIYIGTQNYELLNRLYQAQGLWPEAIDVALRHDRIHLRHTYYNYAKYLENVGAIEAAIDHYELANVHQFEVPRMLVDKPKALEVYIKRKAEPQLFKYWAQYLESVNEFETAKNYYFYASDFLSVVRILCYENNIDDAVKLVDKSEDRAAAFHLANYFEGEENSQLAVHYFSKAGAYSTAIRLAMKYNMIDKLANLALMAGGSELVKVARFYEELPDGADKAVMLYHKAGLIGRALDLAFQVGQLSALDLITQDLNEDSDPRVLERAAEFYAKNQQYQMAVQFMAYAKKYSEAVALCVRKNVIINDDLIEILTPQKKMNQLSAIEKVHLFEEIARCCLQQGSYHNAAKKFAQAGNKFESIKALIKSGDTDRIILFANTARNKDIYKIVGNYLQTLNWKEDAKLMRQVEQCYVKANAMDSLAGFYMACAQVEIDDYKDYEKGIAAYSEALKCINKTEGRESSAGSAGKHVKAFYDDQRETIRKAIDTIRQFLSAKALYESDPGEGLRQLNEMAARDESNEFVRLGDIYAIIVLHYVQQNNFKKAWQAIESCNARKPKIDIRQHINQSTFEQICTEVGVKISRAQSEDADSEAAPTVDYSHAMHRKMIGE